MVVVLLAAVAMDGNNGLFPVAYGVVESERTDSWTFFLAHLAEIIGHETHPLYFMSDQQKVCSCLTLHFLFSK